MRTEAQIRVRLEDESPTAHRQSWEQLWSTRRRIHIYENIAHLAQRFAGDLHGLKVLEVGCGRGATLLNLVNQGAIGTGVDYAESAIQFCRELQSDAGLQDRSEFICGDAFDLSFEPGQFDLVYSIGLIEHFKNPELVLAQQFRVLKPGGLLIVQAPQKYSAYTVLKQILMRLGRWRYGVWETQFSQAELVRLTQSVGFQPEYACGYGSFTLALFRHFLFPDLNFDSGLRIFDSNAILRTLKSHIALDICIVARKPADH